MSKTFGYYLTLTVKDLVSAIMVNEDRTEITKDELYDTFLKTTYKMKKKGINGRVAYSREDLKEFKMENADDFEVGINYIKLSDRHSIEWLQEHVVSYISIDKLQLLGLIPYENDFSL